MLRPANRKEVTLANNHNVVPFAPKPVQASPDKDDARAQGAHPVGATAPRMELTRLVSLIGGEIGPELCSACRCAVCGDPVEPYEELVLEHLAS
ncbi:hypothetical protein [Chenggangzhangella methanolivorans]|uniref:Uncharacterized protein n=1 Tax=Chenggangzhangella methanolivorans TaxID=1437009 RepID=A0A9E6R9F9_9HYPH|nr:hypothetical protein [Chenggangzhangella methanolivorans]QZN99082.1 hypothetical protein K6K41_19850 [Chenggangzhangella methanolivorans]